MYPAACRAGLCIRLTAEQVLMLGHTRWTVQGIQFPRSRSLERALCGCREMVHVLDHRKGHLWKYRQVQVSHIRCRSPEAPHHGGNEPTIELLHRKMKDRHSVFSDSRPQMLVQDQLRRQKPPASVDTNEESRSNS